MKRLEYVEKLNKIYSEIGDLPTDSSLATVVKDLKDINDRFSEVIQELEDEPLEEDKGE